MTLKGSTSTLSWTAAARASYKWDKYRGTDVIPLWVADMDFRSPPAVIEALHERVAHGVFGYGHAPCGLEEAVRASLLADYGWEVAPEWIVWLPGLVSGLNVLCRAVGDPRRRGGHVHSQSIRRSCRRRRWPSAPWSGCRCA